MRGSGANGGDRGLDRCASARRRCRLQPKHSATSSSTKAKACTPSSSASPLRWSP